MILVRSDNTTVCSYLNKVGGMQSDALCKQTLDLCRWALRHDMELRAIYLPGQTNCQADALSRQRQVDLSPFQDLDNRELTLNASVLEAVFLQFSHPQVDLFANRNKRLPVFVSLQRGQGKLAVDALSLSETHQYGYAYPPIHLLPRILDKIRRDKGDDPFDSSKMAPEGMGLRSSSAISRDSTLITFEAGSSGAEGQFSPQSACTQAHGLKIN